MNKELIKEIELNFKDHVAELIEFNDTQIIFWHKPGTNNYSMNVIYSKNFIYISGDLLSAKKLFATIVKEYDDNPSKYFLSQIKDERPWGVNKMRTK